MFQARERVYKPLQEEEDQGDWTENQESLRQNKRLVSRVLCSNIMIVECILASVQVLEVCITWAKL